mmetsp:Transcript_6920/g.25850  ORF Transcript_6920/g.25850 Transcript_6920/m.25850 type:complete len:500 (-) Transcript_6920:3154-4653(-)
MTALGTEDILLIVAANVSAWVTVFVNFIFFSYVIYKIAWIDLGLKPYFDLFVKYRVMDALGIHRKASDVKMINGKATKMKSFGRKPTHKKVFFNRNMRFLCMLQLSTVGSVLADAYTILPVATVPAFCMLQSVQMQVFNWFVFSWSSNVAFYVFYSIMFQKTAQNRHVLSAFLELAAHGFALLTATVFTVIPLATNSFGEAGGWCWVTNKAQQFGTFYGPLWFLIILDTLVYALVLIKIVLTVRRTIGLKKSLKDEKQLKMALKLILYPAIFVLVWTVPTCNRVLGIFKVSHVSLSLFHIFITPLQGTFNVVVYFLNPIGHLRLLRRIFCWPCLLVRSTQSGREFENHAESLTYQLSMLARDTESDEDDGLLIEADRAVPFLDNDYELGEGPIGEGDEFNAINDQFNALPEIDETEGFLQPKDLKAYDGENYAILSDDAISPDEDAETQSLSTSATLINPEPESPDTPEYNKQQELDILFMADEEHVEEGNDMGPETPQ